MTKQKRHYDKNKKQISKKITAKRYGLTTDQYDQLLMEQNFCCALCHVHQSEAPLFVDHCHDTNVVRGFLCNKCNSCLGGFEYHYKNIDSVMSYLERKD